MDQKLINLLTQIATSLERIANAVEEMLEDEIYEDSSAPDVYLSGASVGG